VSIMFTGSSVGIETGYELDVRSSIPCRESDFSLFQYRDRP
jgi:hypothetical protein